MNQRSKKILNDPVYGFINLPQGLIFDIVEHPYFQRLRRIKQTSLTHYVYPGALHTRFHHALGAFHLTTQAVEVLRSKGVDISEAEAEGLAVAVLLHDIGHGPFSHTLEHTLINVPHETLSVLFMQYLNTCFDNQLDIAIQIFKDEYPKQFLHQLVSGQLDMDRMDYLNRDSFFTGVHEGVIGYDRIIKMLAVQNGELVVEEKGIYSVEKFIIARRLMYWQVYLHKTVLSAEQMLIQTFKRARELSEQGLDLKAPDELKFFLNHRITAQDFLTNRDELLRRFAALDDYDIMAALKGWMQTEDTLLAFFSKSLIDRRLFKLKLSNEPFDPAYVAQIREKVEKAKLFPAALTDYLILQGKETNSAYSTTKDEIKILFKNGKVRPMSESADYGIESKIVTKYYICYPKLKSLENIELA